MATIIMAARRASRRTARRTKRRSAKRTARRRRTARRKVVRRRRKARRVSKRGSKRQVFRGSREKTNGGLQKKDLVENRRGKVVSKKMHARGVKLFKKNLSGWNKALMQARANLGCVGFVAVKKGTKLYKEARRLYKK